MSGLRTKVFIGVLAVVAAGANASVLDWSSPAINYPAGALGPVTFTNVDGSGVDMTFQWSGNTNRLLTDYMTGSGTVTLPDDDPALTQTGLSALWYGARFAGSTEHVSLTITFSQPVMNVSFAVDDIDGVDPLYESLRVKGFNGGSTFPVMPDNYGGGDDVLCVDAGPVDNDALTDDGLIFKNLSAADTWPPNSSHQGWVQFNGPITMIGMQFRASPGVDRGQLLGNISFVPEPASLVLLAAGSLMALRRRR